MIDRHAATEEPDVRAPAASILAHFPELEDPRVSPATRHQLLAIVAMALCAVICGADTWVEVEVGGNAKRAWLGPFLALPHGVPSHDTCCGRVFAALDPAPFERSVRSWVAAMAQVTAGVVAVDGTALRRSHDAVQAKETVVLVSAWAEDHCLVLGQVAVAPGSNELPAIPTLLRQVALTGCLVTVDASGCQTAIAVQFAQQGADYLLTLKEDQRALHEAVALLFAAGQGTGAPPAATTIGARLRNPMVTSKCARSGRWRIQR